MSLNLKIALLLFVLLFFSCHEKNVIVEKTVAYKKLKIENDSIKNVIDKYETSSYFNFFNLLKKEEGTITDTIFINDYEALLDKDELLNFYILERIQTLKQSKNKNLIIEKFTGTYDLKPFYDKKNADFTLIKINKDSLYLYKSGEIKFAGKTSFLNSSNKLIQGRIISGRYILNLSELNEYKIIFFNDNLCSDCEQLEFLKKKK